MPCPEGEISRWPLAAGADPRPSAEDRLGISPPPEGQRQGRGTALAKGTLGSLKGGECGKRCWGGGTWSCHSRDEGEMSQDSTAWKGWVRCPVVGTGDTWMVGRQTDRHRALATPTLTWTYIHAWLDHSHQGPPNPGHWLSGPWQLDTSRDGPCPVLTGPAASHAGGTAGRGHTPSGRSRHCPAGCRWHSASSGPLCPPALPPQRRPRLP